MSMTIAEMIQARASGAGKISPGDLAAAMVLQIKGSNGPRTAAGGGGR